jgi:serine protease Do
MRTRAHTRAVALALMCLCIAVGIDGKLSTTTGAQEGSFWAELNTEQVSAVQIPDFADLAAHLNPAVVNISTMQGMQDPRRRTEPFPFPNPFGEHDPSGPFFQRFFGKLPQREVPRHSLGSGFLIAKDGYIVTNSHTVENATDIKVAISDQQEELTAKVIGRDPTTDVALIKIDANRDLPVVPLGDSDKVRAGNWALAIGNPFGLGHTLTAGIVSAKGRVIGAGPYDDFIQTDTSINPGNSGGPLFNARGEVIGINTAITATGQGIGFAIPINLAKQVLIQLREKGGVSRGWLGVQVQRVTPELAHSFGQDQARGALVADVMPNSPADQAGIQPGDIIVEFNGQKIERMDDLPRLVANTPPGAEVDAQLIHRGEEKRVHLTVGALQEPRMAGAESPTPEERLGIAVQNLSPEIARRLGVPPTTRGVVVTSVKEGSPADEVGIQPGDVILEIDRHKTTDVGDYRAALEHMKDHNTALLLVRRGDDTIYLAMTPEP